MAEHERLGRALEESVRRSCEGKRVAIAFSGGLDSGMVAALASKYARSVTCYTCGTDDSFDVAAGRELAEKLGLPWVQCRISEENIENTIREFILATGVSDPFTITYDLQLFTVCREAEERIILTGQGSDELLNGTNNIVTDSDDEYERLRAWGMDRLMKVSVPCETTIARHFKKKLFYPYLDPAVMEAVEALDTDILRPKTLDERKAVLRAAASDLGFPEVSGRIKKASQYGSNTTELIRSMARQKGVRYNRYISDIYEGLGLRNANRLRDAAVDVRVDPILLYDAEKILEEKGMTHSEAVAALYRKMVKEGNLDFLDE